MKAWLCLNQMTHVASPVPGHKWTLEVPVPAPAIGMLLVYRLKKDARSVHGRKAKLVAVHIPEPKEEGK